MTLLDVREADEFEQGAVPGSVFIPRGHLESGSDARIGVRTRTRR
ncbi:MAG: rhodanese-like domain-containing protein [Microthrixaceae bacterium]